MKGEGRQERRNVVHIQSFPPDVNGNVVDRQCGDFGCGLERLVIIIS